MNNTTQRGQLPPNALDVIERWRIQAVPEDEEQERYLEVEPRGAEVTIIEHMAPSGYDPDSSWITRPVALLRYRPEAPADQAWALLCADIDGGWYPYEFFNQPGSEFVSTLEDALEDIEEDRQGWFFGTF